MTRKHQCAQLVLESRLTAGPLSNYDDEESWQALCRAANTARHQVIDGQNYIVREVKSVKYNERQTAAAVLGVKGKKYFSSILYYILDFGS